MTSRFGKHRKMDFSSPEVQHYQPTDEFTVESQPPQQQVSDSNHVQQADPNHNERLQEQQQQLQQREQIYQRHGFIHRHAEQVQVRTIQFFLCKRKLYGVREVVFKTS